jgi:hypothetical protein
MANVCALVGYWRYIDSDANKMSQCGNAIGLSALLFKQTSVIGAQSATKFGRGVHIDPPLCDYVNVLRAAGPLGSDWRHVVPEQ